ncbi:hypothetical protein M231_02820 [Tremella mesenterica]|uniref:Uncharacterized protein n=1 Tax=Tremella mesenterica TaxID=5217 RepID=A0A4Q1BPP6_TREME|nr:hypothetical protein M231_02820 [Tremella mesenterica]
MLDNISVADPRLHLYSLLGIKISQNTSPLLLIPPASPPVLPLPVQALYTQLAFERLNVPGFSLLPSPLATLFALGATTGLVLHVGRKSSSAWVVVDSVVRCDACASIPVGQEDCEIAFLRLLMSDEKLEQELRSVIGEERFNTEGKEKYVKEVCQVVWKECLTDDIEIPVAGGGKGFVVGPTEEEEEEQFDVARKLVGDTSGPSHSHKSKKQQAAIAQAAQAAATKAAAEAQLAAEQAAALDFISLTIPSIPDKEISLGSVRHKICEPLLHSVDIGSETIWEGMGRAVNSPGLSMKERVDVWEAVGVVGDMARIKSFPPALVTYLAPFLLSSAELPSDIQPGHVRLLHIPDYFSNYKGSTLDVAPFLGGCMVSRLAFGDVAGKHAITKVDYNARGPSAIYAVGNEGR